MFWSQTFHNQLNGSFRRIISRIISFAARKDIAAAWYVLIKRQKLKALLGVVNRDPLFCPSSFPFFSFADLFPSILFVLSPNLVLFVLHLSLFCQRDVHDSFESASPWGPGIDSRLSRGGSSYHDGHLATSKSHYITSHFTASKLHTYIQPYARILGPSRFGPQSAFL